MGFAREAADKVMYMADGRVIEEGTAQDIFEHPKDKRIQSFISSIL